MPPREPKNSVLTPQLRRIATVVVLGSIMSILDTTIVAVALDTLSRDFKVSVDTIQWVSTGYLLSLAVVIPVTGWAVDRFGSKNMFIISLSLFIIGSSLCGAAWSANSLIIFRVLQGLGGGMILPVGQSMLAREAGPQRMGRVMSVIGAPTVLGPILGPVLGGIIISNFSWRWIFYINVPVGIVTIVLASRYLSNDEPRIKGNFDLRGFVLLSPGLAALVYALSEVGITGTFTSTEVLVGFVVGVVLIAGFIVHALNVKNPLLELRLLKSRNFALANLCMFILGATLFGSMFILPLYYQVARGQSPWQAGLLMAPQGIGAALVMRKSGAITDRAGPRSIVPTGIMIMAIATLPFTFVTATTDQFFLAATLFIRGLGLGMCLMPITASAYFDLSHADIPRATTTLNILRQIGGSVATALFAVVLQRQIIETTHAHSTSDASLLTGKVKLPPQIASEVAKAFAHTFWWAVVTILIAFVPTLFLPSHGALKAQGAALDAEDAVADAAMTVME